MSAHRKPRATAGDRAERREVAGAAMQIARHLEQRGIRISSQDPLDDLARLLDAVELFEQAVAARGGDSYLNSSSSGRSGRPERPDFVVPRRHEHESAMVYAARVRAAAERLG